MEMLHGRDGEVTMVSSKAVTIPDYVHRFNRLAIEIHADNIAAGWWTDLANGGRKERNVGELLMLVVSELSEADEGQTFGLRDDKLPHRFMIEVELADAKLRILDIAGAHTLDVKEAAIELLNISPSGYQRAERWEGTTAALMRIVNDVSRAMEGHRKKNAPDAHLPHRAAFEVGLASALLRIHTLGMRLCLDVDGAVAEKRAFNRVREDHKVENRRAAGGKAY